MAIFQQFFLSGVLYSVEVLEFISHCRFILTTDIMKATVALILITVYLSCMIQSTSAGGEGITVISPSELKGNYIAGRLTRKVPYLVSGKIIKADPFTGCADQLNNIEEIESYYYQNKSVIIMFKGSSQQSRFVINLHHSWFVFLRRTIDQCNESKRCCGCNKNKRRWARWQR